jgi:hypothetical protein
MAYLGNSPARSFISFERQVFTIVNSQTAYTLDHSVTNENDIRLVINNVVQEPGSGKAYTASGTTLTLSAALVNGTDEMYCVFLGRAVGTVNPPVGSVASTQLAADAVTNAKVASSVITGQTAKTSIATDDLILLSDTSASGALKKMTQANFVAGVGGAMTPAFAATQANTGFTASADSKIAYATEIFDTDNCYDNSSNYRFTPTTAGKYFVFANIAFDADSAYARHQIKIYKNGSHHARSQLKLTSSYFAASDTAANIHYVVDMNGSSDYLEIYGFLDQNGATQNTAGYGVFGAFRIIT